MTDWMRTAATARLTHAAPMTPTSARGRTRPVSTVWIITFADLVALMLTFFVLLFAMSQIQQQKWQSIVESLASNLSATHRIETAKFAADYQVPVDIAPPGAAVDYLEPILREHFASDPLLADAAIDQLADGLKVSFPGEQLFVGGTAELTARGGKIIFALGGVLRNLHNAIDVNASFSADGLAAARNWDNALARSVAVTRILAQSGFAGPIVARGRGDEPAASGAEGLDVLVRADRREQP